MSLSTRDFYKFDRFALQPSRRALLRDGVRIAVSPKSFEVLLYLAQHAGHVVLKDELLKAVWPDSFVEESNLTQHIFSLRKALGDCASYIVTIPGRGYEFTAQVSVVSDESAAQAPAEPVAASALAEFHLHRSTETTRVVIEETTRIPATSAPDARAGVNTRRWMWIAAATAVIIAGSVWAGWRWKHRVVPGDHHEVVLADFDNSTGDPELDRSLKTLLAMDLNDSPFLVVASEGDTRKTLRLMNRSPNEPLSPAVAVEVCQRLNDQVVLSGLVARFGQHYLVTLRASNCADGKDLVGTKAEADSREDLLKAVDRVAAEMRSRLGEPLASLRQSGPRLEAVHTFSLEALKAYADARAIHLSNKMLEAIPLYQRAISLDPNFSSAYAQMALCYINTGQGKKAQEAMAKAYELRDYADGLDKVYITALYEYRQSGDRAAAIRNYQTATRLYPAQAYPWTMLGGLEGDAGRYDEGIAAMKRAIELNPTSPSALPNLAIMEAQAGRLDDAKEDIRRVIAQKVDYPDLHQVLVNIAFLQHDGPAFDREMAWLKQNSERDYDNVESGILFSQGKARAAIALGLKVVELDQSQKLNDRAAAYLGGMARAEADLGLIEQARSNLKRIGPIGDMKNTAASIDTLVAEATVGNPDVAEAVLAQRIAEKPGYTEMNELFGPQVKAAAAMRRGKPADAVALLQPSLPYDFTALDVPLQRGQAYLALHQPEQARQEYRKVIDRPYTDPLSGTVPLAHLGLARALAMQGDQVAARQEYEALFAIWKDGDPDLPPLKQARAEYAKLIKTNAGA